MFTPIPFPLVQLVFQRTLLCSVQPNTHLFSCISALRVRLTAIYGGRLDRHGSCLVNRSPTKRLLFHLLLTRCKRFMIAILG